MSVLEAAARPAVKPAKKQKLPQPRKTAAEHATSIAFNVLMMMFSISCLIPLIWMSYSTFKTMQEFDASILALPSSINFQHYIHIFSVTKMGTFMLNTIRNTAIAMAAILAFGFINGFFIARYEFKGKKLLYGYYLLGMLMPIHALLIPIYILFNSLNMTDKWYTVALPMICFNLPMALFLIESYIKTIPKEIDEAAAIDGSSFSRTLFSIILPITTPILVTAGIITFFTCWNEFSFSLVLLNSEKLFTVPLGLTMFKGQFTTDYPRMMTAMMISMLPAIIIYFCFSKQIIKGMMSGAIKG